MNKLLRRFCAWRIKRNSIKQAECEQAIKTWASVLGLLVTTEESK